MERKTLLALVLLAGVPQGAGARNGKKGGPARPQVTFHVDATGFIAEFKAHGRQRFVDCHPADPSDAHGLFCATLFCGSDACRSAQQVKAVVAQRKLRPAPALPQQGAAWTAPGATLQRAGGKLTSSAGGDLGGFDASWSFGFGDAGSGKVAGIAWSTEGAVDDDLRIEGFYGAPKGSPQGGENRASCGWGQPDPC